MPQARSAGTSTNKSSAARSAAAKRPAAKSTAAKPAAAKPAAAKPAAAKPQAARRTTAKTAAAKPAASRTSAAKTSAASKTSAAAKPRTAAKATAAKAKPRVSIHVNAEGTQVEAVAERVRKLNERIIEVGREAGGNTLASYEKALKAIATGVSKTPKDELEWIQQLAASQAKFVRDITDSWAKAARDRLK
jgi:hypothetical protein